MIGDEVIAWCERFCIDRDGTPLRLPVSWIGRVVDERSRMRVTGWTAAALVLILLAAPAHLRAIQPNVSTDISGFLGAAGPELRTVLKVRGEGLVVPELGTEWRRAA